MSSGLIFIIAAVAFFALGGGSLLSNGLPGASSSSDPYVNALANAIATAEGFFVSGTIPQVQNNPGDIETGGVINTYPTAADGWNALYAQVQVMLYGGSAYYNPSMTIAEVGQIYANGDSNWANNVAASLGVTTDTTLQQWMQQGSV